MRTSTSCLFVIFLSSTSRWCEFIVAPELAAHDVSIIPRLVLLRQAGGIDTQEREDPGGFSFRSPFADDDNDNDNDDV